MKHGGNNTWAQDMTSTHSTTRRKPRFALHDRVITRDGSVGTIVEVYSPYEYEVAFDEEDFTGAWVWAVPDSCLRPYEPPHGPPHFALHDRVATKDEGRVGTIVDIFSPYEYLVEFDDRDPEYPGDWWQYVRSDNLRHIQPLS